MKIMKSGTLVAPKHNAKHKEAVHEIAAAVLLDNGLTPAFLPAASLLVHVFSGPETEKKYTVACVRAFYRHTIVLSHDVILSACAEALSDVIQPQAATADINNDSTIKH